jgi:hypothetical protein
VQLPELWQRIPKHTLSSREGHSQKEQRPTFTLITIFIFKMDSSTSKKPVQELGRDNWKRWFQNMANWLESKDAFFTIQEPVMTPQSESSSAFSSYSKHSSEWRKADATARYWVLLCVSEDDQELVGDQKTAAGIWKLLESKYKRTLKAAGRDLIVQFVSYQMGHDTSIDEAWSHLASLGREIQEVYPDKGYHKVEERIQQLLTSLPAEYRFVRQTINARGTLDPDEILLILKEEERSVNKATDSAMFAKGKQGKSYNSFHLSCLLCNGLHRVSECTHLEQARKHIQGSVDKVTKRRSPPRRSSPQRQNLTTLVKQLTQKVEKLEAAQKSSYKGKAFAAAEGQSPSPSPSPEELSGDDHIEAAGAALQARGKLPCQGWMLDSGCSSHMSDQLTLFRGPLIQIRRRWIKVGGGYLFSDHIGEALVQPEKGKSSTLWALYVPQLGVNLISCRKLCSDLGVSGDLDSNSFRILNKDKQIVLEACIQGGVYVVKSIHKHLSVQGSGFSAFTAIDQTSVSDVAHPAQDETSVGSTENNLEKQDTEYQLWHRRFAHLGAEKIRTLHKVTTLSKPITIPQDEVTPCEVCSLTKMRNRRGKTTQRKAEVLQLVHVDTCGPFEPARNGERYFLHVLDNHSRMTWTYPMNTKDEAPLHLSKWKVEAERESDTKLKAVKSDNAPELVKILKQWETQSGIAHNPTEAYNSLQNGAVERSIQTSEGSMRAMLKDSGLPNEFWPDAVRADVYLRNRTATGPEIDGKVVSPVEAYTGQKPSVDHIRVWGCKVYTYLNPKSLPVHGRHDKLMDRGRVGVFLGYVDGTTKNYKVWAPDMRKMIIASTVKFSEEEKGGNVELNLSITSTQNKAPTRNPVGRPAQRQAVVPEPVQRVFSHIDIPRLTPEEREQLESGIENPQKAPQSDIQTRQQITSRKRQREDNDNEDDEPVSKHLRALFGLEEKKDWDEFEETAMSASIREHVPIPRTYDEAITDPKWGQKWQDAIDQELNALTANNTWEEVVPPRHANLVTSKWVFTTKYNTDGSLDKLKARLVARGFSQRYGVDFEDTFAPTVRFDTLRLFFAIVAMHDLECHQVDVNNAFTESYLREDIYMKPPPGVTVKPGQAFKVLRSLYGLKQAARDWNQCCISKLLELGFTQSQADPCLLTHSEKKLILLVYVDDILLACKSLEQISWFKVAFGRFFKIKDLGEIQKVLGIRVARDRIKGTLRLDQTHYVKEVLDRLNMTKDKEYPVRLPMDNNVLLSSNDQDLRSEKSAYQQGVGSWMYLGILTRPDIAFTLGRLSQFMADPTVTHAKALKKLSKYVRSTSDLGITFRRDGNKTLEGYSDSDFAMDKSDRRSILGNVFMLAGGPVSWMSRKQKSVATSTMEAEYMAMSACAKRSQFLAQVLRDMGYYHEVGSSPWRPVIKESQKHLLGSPMNQTRIYGDNQAALTLVKEPHTHDRAKHIDIAYHFVRDLFKRGRIHVEFVRTTDMAADGLTKPLQGDHFRRFVNLIKLTGDSST